MPEEAKLYIGNIPFKTTKDDLRREFDRFGPIEEIKIIVDRVTDRPKGFAFVTFENVDDSRDAMEKLDQTFLENRQITVEPSRREDDRGRRSDSGRRYDGGRDRYSRSSRDYRRDDRRDNDRGDRRYDRRRDDSGRDDRVRDDRGRRDDRRRDYDDDRSGGRGGRDQYRSYK